MGQGKIKIASSFKFLKRWKRYRDFSHRELVVAENKQRKLYGWVHLKMREENMILKGVPFIAQPVTRRF
jgi:hypothetical protein